ncbi:hypothetical protein IC744_16250 [Microbacterium hominis]|uniref:hypothetical protein n=1 Tax=Microbacterium hominis TaxID=162426 RepID=UPI00168A6445|nr:hypothetical protein [Microbacterium hominis]QOC24812.1 hypothetical protein IC745_10495 [Microbacterium hominis]QOC28866.1 hypothetical protein IC744_16250 [Microbacterium hominis]
MDHTTHTATATLEAAGTVAPIRLRSRWTQRVQTPDGKILIREIEIIGAPTLSSPVNYRIRRNDAHPHRVSKTASIRRADLHAKYVPAR